MAHRASPDDHRRGLLSAVHGRRTRVLVAMVGCLLSVGTPVLVWGAAALTVDGQLTRPPDDPAGLGITGALPGDPRPGTGFSGDGLPGDLSGTRPSGFPAGPNLPDGPLGIPGVVLDAYRRAERTLANSQPGCHLSWSVLAGIGRIESGHASRGRVDALGNTLGPILGPALDGSPGVAAIADTDRGMFDQDTVWDRAVGPMQFIPSSWRSYRVDANRDGIANPHNTYDSTTAAGRYLCSGGGDLTDPAQLQAAVFRYNHSTAYVTTVLRWARAYLSGVVPTPPAPGPVPPSTRGNGGGPPILVAGTPQLAAATPPALLPAAPPSPATTSTPPVPPPLPSATTTTPATTTSPATDSSPPSTTTTTTTAPPVITIPATTTPLPTTTTVPPPPTTDSTPPPTTTTTLAEPALPPPAQP